MRALLKVNMLIALLDADHDPERVHNARQLTDVYLLALAVRHSGGWSPSTIRFPSHPSRAPKRRISSRYNSRFPEPFS